MGKVDLPFASEAITACRNKRSPSTWSPERTDPPLPWQSSGPARPVNLSMNAEASKAPPIRRSFGA